MEVDGGDDLREAIRGLSNEAGRKGAGATRAHVREPGRRVHRGRELTGTRTILD